MGDTAPAPIPYIIPDLRPLAVPIDSVQVDPANARTGHAIDRIAASLTEYGQRVALVVNKSQGNKIEKGNGTWQAARQLGWTQIAVVWVEDDPAKAAGYGIADNRTGDLSAWNLEALASAVEAAEFGGAYTGFEGDELERLLTEIEEEVGSGEAGEQQEATYREQYGVIIICTDAAHQEEVYNDLKEAGYEVKVVVT